MKNIVICCDGTGNEFGGDNTNVVKLHSMLQHNSAQQLTFYDPGVGTFSIVPSLTRPVETLRKTLCLALGAGLKQNVVEAYSFLVRHFGAGDRVYLFGFSRGAYTARVIAAMIQGIGILRRDCEHLANYGLQLIEFRETVDFRVLGAFRRQFSRDVADPFVFLGVWDTVSSVSWMWDRLKYSFTQNNSSVNIVRHAVSIDERRALFRTNLWGDTKPGQDVKEVWFAGVHCDVGGGYPDNESGLSHIALEWMVMEARQHGLIMDNVRITDILRGTVPPDHSATAHQSLTPGWWPCEILPKRFRKPNFGDRRKVVGRDSGRPVLIHESAERRKNLTSMAYSPPNWPTGYVVEPWVPF